MIELESQKNLYRIVQAVHQESLEMNREGRFSETQKITLENRWSKLTWKHFGLIVVALIIAIILSNTIQSLFNVAEGSGLLMLIAFVISSVLGTISLIKTYAKNKAQKTINEGVMSCYGKYTFNFKRKMYIADCNNQQLEPLHIINLLPGAYKFYYSPTPKILLSAEPCPEDEVPFYNPMTESSAATLQRTLGFEESDIVANQKGLLSERQKAKLKILSNESIVRSVIGVGHRKPYGVQPTSDLAIDFFLNFLGPLPNLMRQLWLLFRPSESHKYFIGETVFVMSQTTWLALVEGINYKAYHIENRIKPSSIEIIRE